jgi:D-beta-D-heptose 7-phosphate kinase/D-beta-D-heptose 1-phosphate adenosyltransferase
MTGTFDVVHAGHIAVLQYAKSLGDKLIVAVDSDERVKSLKGNDRPFNNLSDRMLVVSAFKYVDEVYFFSNNEDLEEILKLVSPDIAIAGSDWQGKKYVGDEYIKEIKYFDRIEPYSTTRILKVKQ